MTVPIANAAAILIVEKEPLIAMDVEEMLRLAGFLRTVHVTTSAEADDWLEANAARVVILDLFVRDGPTAPLAAALHARGIPD